VQLWAIFRIRYRAGLFPRFVRSAWQEPKFMIGNFENSANTLRSTNEQNEMITPSNAGRQPHRMLYFQSSMRLKPAQYFDRDQS
jgi:hypothetical protein